MKICRWRCSRVLLAILLLAVVSFSGCTTSAPSTPTSTSPNSPTVTGRLVLLQQNGRLSATFRAMISQYINGDHYVDFPSEFSVSLLPITWTGTSFGGRLSEQGPGEDIINLANGSVSADGSLLVSLVYSRQVTGSGPSSGTFYQVTLQNLPISTTGSFQQVGTDVQQYVVQVGSGSNLSPAQINWSDTSGGQVPALAVTFGK